MKIYNSTIPELTLKRNKTDYKTVKISTSKDAEQYMKQFYFDDISIYESFFLLLLNRSNNTIGYVKISQGGCVSTVVDIRLIAKYAIDSLASSVILCHNHPSRGLTPSTEDKNITEKVKQTLALFECNVIDHIILTEDSYFSFGDNGLL